MGLKCIHNATKIDCTLLWIGFGYSCSWNTQVKSYKHCVTGRQKIEVIHHYFRLIMKNRGDTFCNKIDLLNSIVLTYILYFKYKMRISSLRVQLMGVRNIFMHTF